jgi:hypothetical protein
MSIYSNINLYYYIDYKNINTGINLISYILRIVIIFVLSSQIYIRKFIMK